MKEWVRLEIPTPVAYQMECRILQLHRLFLKDDDLNSTSQSKTRFLFVIGLLLFFWMSFRLSHMQLRSPLHWGLAESGAATRLSSISQIDPHSQLHQALITGTDSTSDDETLNSSPVTSETDPPDQNEASEKLSEARPSDSWQPFSRDGRFGFMQSDQTIIIEPQFEAAFNFTDGLAAVKIDGKYGFIDEDGKIAIAPDYDDVVSFHEGIGVVAKDGVYSYVDSLGRAISDNTYDYAWPYKDGLGLVKVAGKFGYVDSQGVYVLPPIAETTFGFDEGLAPINVNGKFGYIDRTGRFAIDTQFDYAWQFKNGEALVKNGDQYWFIDPTGRFVRSYLEK